MKTACRAFAGGALGERDNSQSWLKQSLQHFACEEQDLVYDYLRYLSYNGQKVRALANPEDLLLCLFLSMKSGVGSKLLHNVEAIAQKNSVKSSIYGRMLPAIMNITASVAIAKRRILRIIFCRSWGAGNVDIQQGAEGVTVNVA